MDLNLFIKHFSEQFEDEPLESFTLSTRFRDLEGWDSLHALSIMAMVNEIYKVKITPEEIRTSQTLTDIYEIVKAKLER